MAGIEKTKEALADLGAVAADLKAISADGLTAGDLLKVPGLAKDLIDLYNDAKAAKDNGEISDLDWTEITELYTQAAAQVGDLLKSAA